MKRKVARDPETGSEGSLEEKMGKQGKPVFREKLG